MAPWNGPKYAQQRVSTAQQWCVVEERRFQAAEAENASRGHALTCAGRPARRRAVAFRPFLLRGAVAQASYNLLTYLLI